MAKKKKVVKKPLKKITKKTAVKKTTKKTAVKKAIKKTTPKKIKKAAPKKAVIKSKAQPAVRKAPAQIASKLVIKPTPVKKIDYSKAVSPLGERLVVRAVAAETMTAGGLYIPDTVDTKERYIKAVVLAAGSGAKNKKGHVQPLDVKIGDTILFPAFASIRIQFNSEELHIVNESDVLGTV